MSWINKTFAVSEWVEVKSEEEILATLDEQSCLDRLPFMPEMLQYCGKKFKVSKSAHKTCDTVNQSGGRRMNDAVHLDMLRCDGGGHGGCQANCLIYWKTAWLKKIDPPSISEVSDTDTTKHEIRLSCDQRILRGAVSEFAGTEPQYCCQATQLFDATSALRSTQMSQYVADVRSKNVPFLEASKIMVLAGLYNLRERGILFRFFVYIYEIAHKVLRKRPAPKWGGTIPIGQTTPDERLDLDIGEMIEVKTVEEILPTLNQDGYNRGLSFDPEMTPYCGRQFRVAQRVEKIVDEKTGEMMHFSNPCIVLDGVICQGQYSKLRLMCPRQITPYWREIWLRRVANSNDSV